MQGYSLGLSGWADKVANVPRAIPYRTDAPISVGTFALALLVTLGLLGLLVAALVFIRRRGWLSSMDSTRSSAVSGDVKLSSSRRISISTTVHVVSYQDHDYLIVESQRGASTSIIPVESDRVLPKGMP